MDCDMLSEAEEVESETEPENEANTQTRKSAPTSALVIEDSMPMRRILCEILSTANFDTAEAANGKEGLDILREHGPEKFDVIICDIRMPVLDGVGFLARARKIYGDSLPPILVCSSHTDLRIIKTVMKLGVSGYLQKPFKAAAVIDKLREICQ